MMPWTLRFFGCVLGISINLAAAATPWRPTQATSIVASLPSTFSGVISRRAVPDSSAEALADRADQIQQHLQNAYLLGDPRELGQAQALLAPFSSANSRTQNNPTVLWFLAQIAQAEHRFDDARQHLKNYITHSTAQNSDPSSAYLQAASIDLVEGQFVDAQKNCQQITSLSLLPLRLACIAQIEAMTGKSAAAQQKLTGLAALSASLSAEQALWINLMLADIALRQNNNALAEQVFRRLDLSVPALMARADWLLAHQKWAKVRTLLANHTDNDSLLVRLIRAESQLKSAQLADHIALMNERMTVWQQRGESAHQREQAFYQWTTGQYPQALKTAQSNWQHQRETADFMIYLNAALANNSRKDLQLLLQWMNETGFEYPLVRQRLMQHLGAAP